MSRPPSIKQQLLALWRSNRDSAHRMGQHWAAAHYDAMIRELSSRGSGALPAWARLEAERFGTLIKRPQ